MTDILRVAPPADVYLQLYIGGMPRPAVNLPWAVARVRELSLSEGVVFHGFPRGMQRNFKRYAAMAKQHNLFAMASWGLDGRADEDGTPLTAREKGICVGDVLSMPECVAGLLDAEGQWDSDTGDADDMDEAGALEMGRQIRKAAPTAIVGDQCWFAIEAHTNPRRTPRPIGMGGPVSGFPVDEFAASAVNWGRFVQAYANHAAYKAAHGTNRWPKVKARMDREWLSLNKDLAAADPRLVLPVSLTLQGYGWDDCPWHLVNALVEYVGIRKLPVFIWCDWWPEVLTLAAIRAAKMVIATGLCAGETDAKVVIRKFQERWNSNAPGVYRSTADGAMGPLWFKVLGLVS